MNKPRRKARRRANEVTTTMAMPSISRTLQMKMTNPSRDLADYNLGCPSCGSTFPSYLNNYPRACPMCGGELFERKRGKVSEQSGATMMPGTRIRCRLTGKAGTVNKVMGNGAFVFWDDGDTEMCLLDSLIAEDDNTYDPLVGQETDPEAQQALDVGYGTAISGVYNPDSLGVRMGRVGESKARRMRESIMSPLGDDGINSLRTIVHDGTATKVHGIMIDIFTASVVLAVYDLLNDSNKEKLKGMGIGRAIDRSVKLFAKVK
jgi:predicted  nucleic acid-binding Zn-ribbon protein